MRFLKLMSPWRIMMVLAVLGPAATAAGTGVASRGDACSAPLPVELTFTGGASDVTQLKSGGAALSLAQFPGDLRQDLAMFHVKPLVNDRPGEFTVLLPRLAHVYAGPVHIFRHGAVQHVCRSGPIAVDKRGNSTEQVNAYRLVVRLDGTITGTRAIITAWVKGKKYRFVGKYRR